jgi:hypothetical protein
VKIQSEFKTRKSAVAYLVERGWRFCRITWMGDAILSHDGLRPAFRRVERERPGRWVIVESSDFSHGRI